MIQFLAILNALVIPLISVDDLESRLERGRDTVYIVNFWATWCKPCVKELPAFDKLSHEYRNQSVKILLVSIDDQAELDTKVKPFIKKQGLHTEVLLLNETKPHKWIDRVDSTWSGAIPATMIVQRSTGRKMFYEKDFSYDELNQILTTFLKNTQ